MYNITTHKNYSIKPLASLRFRGSEAKSGHIWSTSFHVEESDGWCSLPSYSLSLACHIRCLAVSEDWNILLNLGIGGKYYKTFAGTPFLIFPSSLFVFHLDFPQVGHAITSLYWFLYKIQSLGHA